MLFVFLTQQLQIEVLTIPQCISKLCFFIFKYWIIRHSILLFTMKVNNYHTS